jgi:sugar lactone lactonase YvrE
MAVVSFAQIRPDITPGDIVIATTPRADIFLDDKELGAASSSGSFVVHGVKPGSHILRVTEEGKHPFTKRIMVAAGETSRVHAELGDLTGDLEVLTAAGAEIFLNGKSVGVADDTGKLLVRGLSEPRYKVRAAKAGRSSEELQISPAVNLVSSINLELKLADEVNDGTAAPPPDYVLQRRLASSEGARVKHVFFQVNSGRLVSIGQNGKTGYIAQWDPSTGRLLETIEVKARDGIISVSPDLRWAALDTRKPTLNPEKSVRYVQLVEIANGRLAREWLGDDAYFTPDSKRLAIGVYGQGSILWNIDDDKQIETWPEAKYGMLYSTDGHLVAMRDGEGVSVRDMQSGKTIQQLDSHICCHGAAFSPDDRWLSLTGDENNGSQGRFELWEIATGRQRRTFESPLPYGDKLSAYAVVFTPDSRHIISIVSTSWPKESNPPGIWVLETLTGRPMRKWPTKDPNAIALSPDGRWLAVLDNDSSTTIWKRRE